MLRLIVAALVCLASAGAALAQSNDFSDQITVGGTSQIAIAAKPAGQVIFVQNPGVETETLWVNFGAAAAAAVANTSGTSIGLAPGGSISINTTQSVNVVASDTNHVYIAKTLSAAAVDNSAGGAVSAAITSVVPGTGATNSGKAEDAAHTTGDTGALMLGVRSDTATSTATTDGDYTAPIFDSSGRQWVNPQGNVAHDGVDSGNPIKIGGVVRGTAPAMADGDRGDVRMLADGSIFAAPAYSAYTPVDGTTNASTFGAGFRNSTTAAALLGMTGTMIRGDGGTWNTNFNCTNSATVSVTAGNTLEIVALTASQQIRVCAFTVSMTIAGGAQWAYGTGTNCGTGTTNLTAQVPLPAVTPWAMAVGSGSLFRTASGNALCLIATTGDARGFVSYAKF